MTNALLYTGIKQNAPWLARHTLDKYTRKLKQLRKDYPTADTSEKQTLEAEAKEIKEIIALLQ